MFRKSKKQEPSDAGGDDKSDCPAMEGFLKKLNSQGVWKDRYCQLQNAYFMTYKPKDKKGPSNEVKESVNLKVLQSASINIDDCLELVLENGDKLLYKGPDLNMWLGKITIRADWAQDKIKAPLLMAESSDLQDPARTSSEASSNNSSAMIPISQSMEGLLKKKNSQGVWKDRYCQLKNSFFMTYKPVADKSGPSDELKETIDLKKLVKILVTAADMLEITLSSGEFFQYRGAALDVWIDCISKRSTWAQMTAGTYSPTRKHADSNATEVSSGTGDAEEDVEQGEQEAVEKRHMEGSLKKKNSAGVWKDRFCHLQNVYMITYKPKEKDGKAGPSGEVKETIDLRNLSKTFITTEDVLEITLVNGDLFEFQGYALDVWQESINLRSKWAIQQQKSSASTVNQRASTKIASAIVVPAVLEEDNDISGWLMKKSHSKYQGYQNRYVKLEGSILKYYKSDSSNEVELGVANMLTAEFVRPFDATPSCNVFEIKDEDRVFIFQTKNNSEMQRWVLHLQQARLVSQLQMSQEQQEKIKEATPIRIRWFDELGEEGFTSNIRDDLEEMYPLTTSEAYGEFSTLKQHLTCANDLVEYLREFLPEVQKTADRPARYDILAVMMTLVNAALEDRLGPILSTAVQSEPTADDDISVRHDLLEWATLGDLHYLIDWLTRYQSTLKKIVCPTRATKSRDDGDGSPVPNNKVPTNPKSCNLFDYLGGICGIYVYGGTLTAKGGAAAHLYEHCRKVWDSVLRSPEEMLQRHQDGTFYTHSPTDMWEAINQHISLATSTQSPILHVMIADKVVTSLTPLIDQIADYVTNTLPQETADKPELKEIELEFVSALANDTAMHIEEVIQLIETFTIAEIREKIDEIFDPLTTNLIKCGQACLNRLTSLVMQDVHELLDTVLMPDWLEGNQISVCINTISDYMRDLLEFLVPFWAEKLVHTVLEAVVLGYTRNIVFPRRAAKQSLTSMFFSALGSPSADDPPTPPPATTPTSVKQPEKSGGFFSSMFKSKSSPAKDNKPAPVLTIEAKLPTPNSYNAGRCPVDPESLGRIAQDINTLNSFFSKKAGQDTATDYLEILNDVSLMLFTEYDHVIKHSINRIGEFPSSAEAVFQTSLGCLKLRDDISTDEIEIFDEQLRPALDCAPAAVEQNELLQIAEGRLGLFYNDLVPKEILQAALKSSGASDGISLAQKKKNMSNIPLFKKKRDPNRTAADEDGDNDSDSANSEDEQEVQEEQPRSLLGGVIEAISQQEEEERAWQLSREEELLREEEMRKKVGILTYDGYLEKKSPAHNLWQRRWFKLSTRESSPPNLEKPYVYTFMWYKKEGGAVIKSIDVTNIASIAVMQTPRPLAYLQDSGTLTLQSDALLHKDAVSVIALDLDAMNCPVSEPTITIRIMQADGKENLLRGAKVDRVIKWINLLSLAGSLRYDPVEKMWNKKHIDG